jgi:hypothetical protein
MVARNYEIVLIAHNLRFYGIKTTGKTPVVLLFWWYKIRWGIFDVVLWHQNFTGCCIRNKMNASGFDRHYFIKYMAATANPIITTAHRNIPGLI